jgi:diguanylate cyclase (GGDEF)-like protein
MNNFFKNLSLAPASIRRKLFVSFALMSLIPMFVFGFYLYYYILPTMSTFWEVFSVFVITIFLMLIGFFLAQKLIYPIVEIALHAKGIVEGKAVKELKISGEDEIGELGGSLNRISGRLKENMTELRSYGEKIKAINMEINKKVFALSGLLQISNLITSSADLTTVLALITEKLSLLQGTGSAFLMFRDEKSGELNISAHSNIESEQIGQLKIKVGQGVLGKVFETNQTLIIDARTKARVVNGNLAAILPKKNIIIMPVSCSGRVIGVLGIGNNLENFYFTDDELELIGVFGKQISVAVENDMLLRKTEELTVKDDLTGLYNESYLRSRLDEEIKRAVSYQRPCGLMILDVDNFEQYQRLLGTAGAEKALKKIARTLQESTSDIDKTARFSDRQFAVILPEKNKRQCSALAENIRKEIERFGLSQSGFNSDLHLTVSIGIGATPIDGTTSVELINKALGYLEKAQGSGNNKIVNS